MSNSAASSSPTHIAILGCALVTWMGCEPNAPVDVVSESVHFRFSSSPKEAVCPSILDELERHYVAVKARLPFAESARKIEYFKIPNGSRPGRCPAGAESCAIMRADGQVEVHSANELHEHELVHAYLLPEGWPHNLYFEGVADAFYCAANSINDPSIPVPSWRDLVELPDLPADNYQHARRFVRQLIDQIGPARFMEFYRIARVDHTVDSFRQEFENNFGLALDDVWAAAQSRTFRGGNGAFCVCDGRSPQLDIQTELGPVCNNSFSRRSVQVTVGTPSTLWLTVGGGVSGVLAACSGDSMQTVQVQSADDQDIVFLGENDTYYLELWDTTQGVVRAPFTRSASCPQTPALAVNASTLRLDSGCESVAEFHLSTPRAYSWVGLTPKLCDTCDQCSDLVDGSNAPRALPAGDVLVRVMDATFR